MGLTEERIISECRAGKKEAFELLVRSYGNQVYHIVLPLVHRREDAQDIAQEAFIKAYRNIDTFRGDSGIGTWLCSIAINAARDHLRKNIPEPRDTTLEETRDPNDAYAKKDAQILLREALSKLSVDEKEIIVLKDLNGFSYAEIAGMLSIEIGTVKSRLSRARYALREVLKQDEADNAMGKQDKRSETNV